MAKFYVEAIVLLLVVLLPIANGLGISSIDGGSNCASCTVIVGLVEKLSIAYNESVIDSLERLCNALPTTLRAYCKVSVDFLGPVIIDGLAKGNSPDVICHALKLCTDDPGQVKCRLYQTASERSFAEQVFYLRQRHSLPFSESPHVKICDIPGIKEICKIIDNAFQHHEPSVDLDGDTFGTEQALRGTSWRGKDCNDFSSAIHPGARVVDGDSVIDHNCNGIFGMNSATGNAWENEFCNETTRLGIAVLGDSISAHFHIPEQWLDASQFSPEAFEHAMLILENELDWPQLSAVTGHLNVSWPNIEGPTRSLYARLFDLDHCNHRDYQNIAVNGADSKSILDIAKALKRNQKNDVPLLVVYSVVGNDVCNGHPDTIDHMTTPKEMYKNTITGLTYLDTLLPKGSHVLTTGLANGSVLYQLLHDRIHPFGRVGKPFTYKDIYTYLSCLQISPCNGWLTSNDTLRALTTQRAVELSDAVRNATYSYQPVNFDVAYVDFPFDQVFKDWVAHGGEPWQLLESVDGFHTNQYGNAGVSDAYWSWLQQNRPQWLPPVNPHNADIERVFKDQGGY